MGNQICRTIRRALSLLLAVCLLTETAGTALAAATDTDLDQNAVIDEETGKLVAGVSTDVNWVSAFMEDIGFDMDLFLTDGMYYDFDHYDDWYLETENGQAAMAGSWYYSYSPEVDWWSTDFTPAGIEGFLQKYNISDWDYFDYIVRSYGGRGYTDAGPMCAGMVNFAWLGYVRLEDKDPARLKFSELLDTAEVCSKIPDDPWYGKGSWRMYNWNNCGSISQALGLIKEGTIEDTTGSQQIYRAPEFESSEVADYIDSLSVGDIILFNDELNLSWSTDSHVALYLGYANGQHWIAHTNKRENGLRARVTSLEGFCQQISGVKDIHKVTSYIDKMCWRDTEVRLAIEKKTDAENYNAKKADFSGTVFQVDFYENEEFTTDEECEVYAPTYTWYLKTLWDSETKSWRAVLDEEHLVTGDEGWTMNDGTAIPASDPFAKNLDGEAFLKVGTVRITEVRSASAYVSDPTFSLVKEEGGAETRYEDSIVLNVKSTSSGDYQAYNAYTGKAADSTMITAVDRKDMTVPEDADSMAFEDVTDDSVYYFEPVRWAAYNKISTGRAQLTESGNRIFDPMATCTRAEIVTFLWRMAGKPLPSSEICEFSDVSPNAYYYTAVQWAYERGITTGRSATAEDGSKIFDPDATCTRREIVTFLWRYAGKPQPRTTVSTFTDVTETDAYYYKAVLWAVERRITTGKASTNYTTFDPTGLCTRGMTVTFLYRYSQ